MEEAILCGFDLRLWLWSIDVLKYFLGRPSPKLPVRTDIFSKMKTLSKEVESSGRSPGLSCQNGVIHLLCGVSLAG